MMRRTLHACRQATYGQRACKFLNFKNLGYHRVLHETMFDKDIISISNKMFFAQVNTNGAVKEIPFGACVWATGVAMPSTCQAAPGFCISALSISGQN